MINSRFDAVNARGRWGATLTVLLLSTFAIAQEVATEKATDVGKAGSVPRLELSQTVWDFGTVWSGDKVSTTITLRNAGDAALMITQVKSSCGCTATKHTKQMLAPGESDEIEISYNTKKQAEKVSQTVRIHTNDPATPIAKLEVRGIVRQILEMDPSSFVNIGRIGLDEEVTRSIEIKCNYTEPLHLTMDILRPSDDLDVKFEELEPGHRYKVTATTKPPLEMGSLRAMVGLNTGLERLPQVAVHVHAIAQPPVLVTPLKIVLPRKDQSQTQTLHLTNHTGTPIAITSIQASHPSITAEILPRPNQPARRGPDITNIRATFPPTAELPDEDVTITVATDNSEFEEFVIPVSKRIGKPGHRGQERPSATPVKIRPGTATGRKAPAKPETPDSEKQ